MALKIMILGANGFIGSALTNAILKTRPWEVYGIDLADNKLKDLPQTDRFHFVEGDITINKEWVEYHVKKCDAVVPLVAIANPAQYVTHPLKVFELDFEANLDVVRHCVKYGKRLIFPSTSEIYGMSEDSVLDEETSSLVYGPVNKQRWIYAASKQLLDRVIYAYGVRDNLDYTLFRPFNFIGRTWTTSRSRRRAARASSRSSSPTCSTSAPSSSSMAEGRSAPSPTSTMRSRPC